MALRVDREDLFKKEDALLSEDDMKQLEKEFDVGSIGDMVVMLPKIEEHQNKKIVKDEWLKNQKLD